MDEQRIGKIVVFGHSWRTRFYDEMLLQSWADRRPPWSWSVDWNKLVAPRLTMWLGRIGEAKLRLREAHRALRGEWGDDY